MALKEWSDYRLTKAGRELRQKIIANGSGISFTRAAIGTGKPENISEVENLTELVNYEREAILVKSYEQKANHYHKVRVDNIGQTEAILMTEIAVFAKEKGRPDNETILYGYTYNIDSYVNIPSFNDRHKIYDAVLNTVLSNAVTVEIVYDGAGVYATLDDVDELKKQTKTDIATHNTDPAAHPYTNENMPDVKNTAEALDEISSQLSNKANKIEGKGLSTNDYSDSDKAAVEMIPQKAPLVSPTFTGNPTAPTQATTNKSTSLATTEFVHKILENKAIKGSPQKLPISNLTSTGTKGIGFYCKDQFGYVTIQAQLTRDTLVDGGILITLPPEYRPPYGGYMWIVPCTKNGVVNGHGIAIINPDTGHLTINQQTAGANAANIAIGFYVA